MRDPDALARELLNLSLPGDYSDFMRHYGDRLAEDPIAGESWIPGLGNLDFAIGTTEAFRSSLRGFPRDAVVIAYQGMKRIEKINEEVRVYVLLKAPEGGLFLVDDLGAVDATRLADGFQQWIGPALDRALLGSRYKSTLFAIAFQGEERAEEVRRELEKLEGEALIDLEDSVVVVRRVDGKVRLHQSRGGAVKGAAGGGLTGLLIGSLFLTPFLGAAFGALAGAFSRGLSDTGIDDEFIRQLASTLDPGSSALFVLVRKADPEKVMARMEGIGGRILTTTVGKEREAALQALLDAHPGETA